MTRRKLTALAFKKIAAMTDREYWQGVMYLEIPEDTAAAVRKRALRSSHERP